MILRRLFPTDGLSVDLDDKLDRDSLDALYLPPRSPWLRLNLISSVSGSAAGADGTSESLTGGADRRILGAIRRTADVVLVGAASVRAEGYRIPQRAKLAILTNSGDLSGHRVSGEVEQGRVIVICPASAVDTARESLHPIQAEFISIEPVDGRLPIVAAVSALVGRGLSSIVCEGGPTLAAQLFEANILDELCLSTSPVVTSTRLALLGGADFDERGLELSQLLIDETSGLYARWSVSRSDAPAGEAPAASR